MRKLLLLVFLAFLFIHAAPSPEKPNLLLVTIDTWRADYISFSGSGRVRTPFLDSLAKEGSCIPDMETPSTITTPAHASILTGNYPSEHGIRDNTHFKLKENAVTMARLFKEAGYRTIGVISAAPLRKVYGLDNCFEDYDEEGVGPEGDGAMTPSSRTGATSAGRALELASGSKPGPLFLWLHLYDPHYPYSPPAEFGRQYPNDPYAGEVAYTDSVLAGFVPALLSKKPGTWIVIVTGDHGEGLGERDEMTHGFLLYKETRQVPFVLWRNDGRREKFGDGAKSLVDIFPTVCRMFSLRSTPCAGVSLFADTRDRRWLFSETYFPTFSFGANPAFSARRDGAIYIEHGTSREVYEDRGEKDNLYQARGDFAFQARKEMAGIFHAGDLPSPDLSMTSAELEALKSLGYMGSPTGAVRKVMSCDLREFSRDYTNYFSRGNEHRRKGELNQALLDYNSMAEKYPGSSVLHFEKGGLLMKMDRYKEAKDQFILCLKLDPGHTKAMVNLGNIYSREGNSREAENLYLSALKLEEGLAAAHINLAYLYYGDPGKKPLVISHLRRFLDLAPDSSQRAQVEATIRELLAPENTPTSK